MELDDLLTDLLEPHVVSRDSGGDRLVAMRLADDWGVAFRLHRRGTHRQWDVRQVSMRVLADGRSITGDDVRDLPLGSMLAEARRLATKADAGEERRARPPGLDAVLERSGGSFGSGDLALATLALEYVTLVESGDRSPSKSLAARFGGTPGSWTNRVALARRRGFLTEVVRGRAGGALTARARTLLGLQERADR